MKLLPARAPKVEKLKRKSDVDGLIRALEYTDVVTDRRGGAVDLGAPVRQRVAEALAELGPSANRALVRTLDDPDEGVRLAGIEGLGRQRDPDTTAGLIDAVARWNRPSHQVSRRQALDALAEFGDLTVTEKLAAAFLRREEPLTTADGDALQRLAVRGGDREAAVAHLVAALESELDEIRGRATRMLVWLAPESIEALITAVSEGDSEIQLRAAFALGEIRDSRAVEPLIDLLLESGNAAARASAAWALGQIKDPTAVEALVRATADSDYGVRSAAGAGLDTLGTVAVIVGVSAVVSPLLSDGEPVKGEAALEAHLGNALGEPAGEGADSSSSRSGALLRRLLDREQ